MSVFDGAFAVIVGHEGGFTADASDAGNWTGGRVGVGTCKGTKFGISAASYPAVDIAALSPDQAKAIYRRDYWDKIGGDDLPPPLALLVFDAAVNNGVSRAVRWLQAAVGVAVDGVQGPATLRAVSAKSVEGTALLAEYQAQRLTFMAGLPTWRTYGLGWARRLCRLPFEAVNMGGADGC